MVQLFEDKQALSRAVAAQVVTVARQSVAVRGRFSLVLAGGSTPLSLYAQLAEHHRTEMPWAQTYVFWGDERYVPYDHPDSNYRAAAEVLLRRVPIPTAQVYPIPVDEAEPEAAAARYAETLRRFAEPEDRPRFDVVLLGLGADGHTASLFPGPDFEAMRKQPDRAGVRAVLGPSSRPPRQRITLTLPLINQARNVFFLVAGQPKQVPLQAILQQTEASRQLPAAHVRPEGSLIWFVDEAAYGSKTVSAEDEAR